MAALVGHWWASLMGQSEDAPHDVGLRGPRLRAVKRPRSIYVDPTLTSSSSDDEDDAQEDLDQTRSLSLRNSWAFEHPDPWVWSVAGLSPGNLFVAPQFPMQLHDSTPRDAPMHAEQRQQQLERQTPRKRSSGGLETYCGQGSLQDGEAGGHHRVPLSPSAGAAPSEDRRSDDAEPCSSPSCISATPTEASGPVSDQACVSATPYSSPAPEDEMLEEDPNAGCCSSPATAEALDSGAKQHASASSHGEALLSAVQQAANEQVTGGSPPSRDEVHGSSVAVLPSADAVPIAQLQQRADQPLSFVAVAEDANAGHRNYMEDRTSVAMEDGVCCIGVYDGHGGCDASIFLKQHLLPSIRNKLSPGADVAEAMSSAFKETNEAFRTTGSIQGSTATTVVLHGTQLVAANVGDSPAFVVTRNGHVYCTFQEHKIEGMELARVSSQGVPILKNPAGPTYMGTVDGTRWLNMSRAFGDFVYTAVLCEPFVCSLDVRDAQYLVMGSDGLTERWPIAEAARFVQQMVRQGLRDPAYMARALVQRSLARGSTDNISAVVVDIQGYLSSVGIDTSADGHNHHKGDIAAAADHHWARLAAAPPAAVTAVAAAAQAPQPAAQEEELQEGFDGEGGMELIDDYLQGVFAGKEAADAGEQAQQQAHVLDLKRGAEEPQGAAPCKRVSSPSGASSGVRHPLPDVIFSGDAIAPQSPEGEPAAAAAAASVAAAVVEVVA